MLGEEWDEASAPIIPESEIYAPMFARLRSLDTATTPLRSDPPKPDTDDAPNEPDIVGAGDTDADIDDNDPHHDDTAT
ncbi:MAG: hypothetical protein IIC53_13110 [Proteobacteria bacterium]|nr:hypothetical protein [Pseudomonadota bacterium]